MVNLLLMIVVFYIYIHLLAGKGYASGYFDNGEDDFGEYPEEEECKIFL